MQLFRIHGANYSPFDTMGTFLHSGRWHTRGTRLLYAAEHVSLAALEVLVHAGGKGIPPKVLTRIHLPDEISTEESGAMELGASQRFGTRWAESGRSAVLRVPAIVVHGLEFNYLLNPAHPEFRLLRHDTPIAFPFDQRLFAGQ